MYLFYLIKIDALKTTLLVKHLIIDFIWSASPTKFTNSTLVIPALLLEKARKSETPGEAPNQDVEIRIRKFSGTVFSTQKFSPGDGFPDVKRPNTRIGS